MKRNKIKKILLGALMTLPIAWVSTACQNDKNDEPASKSEQFSLWLNLTTQSEATRTAGDGTADATVAESFIDIAGGDFKVYLYDEQDNYLKEFDSSDFLTSGDAENGYTATLPLVFSSDESQLSEEDRRVKEIIKNKTANGLQILVLANWKAFESQKEYPVLSSSGNEPGKSLSSLWSNANEYNFSYNAENGTSWNPDHQASPKKLIPMFGMATVSSYTTLAQGGTYAIFNSVPMLRALAKIEIIDEIPGDAKITNVLLSKYNTTGRLIPDIDAKDEDLNLSNDKWFEANTQLAVSSLPAAVASSSTSLKLFKEENKKVEGLNTAYTVYTAYIPEMSLKNLALSDTERPRLKVSVGDGISDSSKDLWYDVHFAQYLNGSPTVGYDYLIRNHIYRYEIKSVNVTADLELRVLPWDDAKEEIWYYEELPGTIDPIMWFYGDEKAETNDANAEVTLNISDEANKILRGEFTIDQPISGIWHAYLMTVGDALATAIQFCDENGNDLNVDGVTIYSDHHISGPISKDKEKADPLTIYIKSTNLGVTGESRFKLLIMVENMSNWMEVNLAPGDNKNWIIIRPSNDFTSGGNSGNTGDGGNTGDNP